MNLARKAAGVLAGIAATYLTAVAVALGVGVIQAERKLRRQS